MRRPQVLVDRFGIEVIQRARRTETRASLSTAGVEVCVRWGIDLNVMSNRIGWVRLGFSWTGNLEPHWKPTKMYRGMITRTAWRIPGLGWGPWLMVFAPKEEQGGLD